MRGDQLVWSSDDTFSIGSTTFECQVADRFHSTIDRFCIVKPRPMVERYVQLIDQLQPRRIAELGINRGGSTAMLAALTDPEVLLAVDLIPHRVAALDAFVDAQGLAGRAHIHWGIDQSDKQLLARLADEASGGDPYDLVIDDASHDLALTRASFEVLFPRLRPRGTYLIEDWSWAHIGWNNRRVGDTPLTVLAFELIVALPQTPGLIEHIEVSRDWVAVTRGDLELPLEGFRVADWYASRGRDLIAPLADEEPGRMVNAVEQGWT